MTVDSGLKTLLKRLHNTHDPDSRAVVREVEHLMREAEAWRFKYDRAMARIECLECQLAEAEHECPVYIREKAQGKI